MSPVAVRPGVYEAGNLDELPSILGTALTLRLIGREGFP
jgi:hypothetical protein